MVNLISTLFRTKTPDEQFMSQWKSAIKHKNKSKMLKLLNSRLNSCSHRNSNCGVEVFCPECPMISPVQNNRYIG